MYIATFLLFLLCFINLNAENRIIYLISAPRSLSTAFLRMMEARHDFTLFNEPSQAAFETAYFHDMSVDWYAENAPKNFQEVKEMIFSTAQTSSVFVKEISYGVHDAILQDELFMQDTRIQFAILVRDPHAIAISFYQKIKHVPEHYDVLIGTKKLYELYETLVKQSPNPVPIVFAEDLAANPKETVSALCKGLSIPFLEESLSWSKHDDKGYENWNEFKKNSSVELWHGAALKSETFSNLTHYEKDSTGKPTFAEIEDPQDRLKIENAYGENAPYYELFLKTNNLKK